MTSFTVNSSESSGLSLAIRLQGDASSEAWTEMVELYGPLVDSWARKADLSEPARADIVQEVFLAVHRSIATFDPTVPNATFRGWLWRITRNAVLQSLRKPEPAPRGGSSAQAFMNSIDDPNAESLSVWISLSESEPPSDSTATASLLRRAMDQIKSRVDEQTWKAFWQTTVLSQSATDVAEQLGMTAAAVRKAKSRTIQRLRKQLGDQT